MVTPAIGWVSLSEADRATAMRLLQENVSDGTRDELGLGAIHFAYSDRFFPGTSVLHGRLRYVFFVAWTYRELLENQAGGSFPLEELRAVERRVANRLIATVPSLQNSGISGWQRYEAGREPVVLASRIYWNALKIWRLVTPSQHRAVPPTQSELHRSWPKLVAFDHGGDGAATVVATVLDPELPPPPSDWRRKSGPLDFTLTKPEADYIKRRWREAGDQNSPLISALADDRIFGKPMFSRAIIDRAHHNDVQALHRAQKAASLACVARALHAALIEMLRNKDLKLQDSYHRRALVRLAGIHGATALSLDISSLKKEMVLEDDLRKILQAAQEWLKGQTDQFEALLPIFRWRECSLKDQLAYLVSQERRETWSKGEARPLEYRWSNVDRLLTDLANAA
jgi:hypothetical protein